jgi:hypothetical protein
MGFFLSFICHFFSEPSIFLGQAWADGKGKLATCRHRADSGGETVKNVRRHSLDRLHASIITQNKKYSWLSEQQFQLWAATLMVIRSRSRPSPVDAKMVVYSWPRLAALEASVDCEGGI